MVPLIDAKSPLIEEKDMFLFLGKLFEWLLLGTNGATIGLCNPITKPETLLIGPFDGEEEEEAGGGDDEIALLRTPDSGRADDPADSMLLMVRLRIRFS